MNAGLVDLAGLAVPARPRRRRHGGQWPTHAHKTRMRRALARAARIAAQRDAAVPASRRPR